MKKARRASASKKEPKKGDLKARKKDTDKKARRKAAAAEDDGDDGDIMKDIGLFLRNYQGPPPGNPDVTPLFVQTTVQAALQPINQNLADMFAILKELKK